MRKVNLFVLAVVAVSLVVALAWAGGDYGSKKKGNDLVGTWALVSLHLEQDGKETEFYGSNPKGLSILDSNGHFARVITRSDLPKFASNNREAGTPEENKAVVRGSIAYFGTYSYNAADKSCTFHVEASTFPNWAGADQKRVCTLAGDELRETNPVASTGTGKSRIVWKRVP